MFGNSMFRLNRWNWWRPSNPKSYKFENVISFLMNGRKMWKHASKTGEKKTWKNYSEDLEISTISMIKKGLFPSLALKTAPLRGRQMQAASLHLISKTNKTAVQDIQWSSYVFFTCWIQCQLSRCSHVKSVKNIHDDIPQHQMADFHGFPGYQGGMYLSNEEHDNFLASCWSPNLWLLFLRVFLDKLGANKVNINWNTPPTEVCIHNNAEPPKKIEN